MLFVNRECLTTMPFTALRLQLRSFSTAPGLASRRARQPPREMATTTADIEEIHAHACAAGKDNYVDPASGYMCFTELFHRKRGKCCGSACRHCPFNHDRVPESKRSLIKTPILVSPELGKQLGFDQLKPNPSSKDDSS